MKKTNTANDFNQTQIILDILSRSQSIIFISDFKYNKNCNK